LPAWTDARRHLAARYLDLLRDLPLRLPAARAGTDPVWHLFAVRAKDRDGLARALAERSVATAIHYPRALPDQPCYQAAGACRTVGELPNARRAAAVTLSLPLFPVMSEQQHDMVARAVREIVGG